MGGCGDGWVVLVMVGGCGDVWVGGCGEEKKVTHKMSNSTSQVTLLQTYMYM